LAKRFQVCCHASDVGAAMAEVLHNEIAARRHIALDHQRTQAFIEPFRLEVLRAKPDI
jgi:hypothetical protein